MSGHFLGFHLLAVYTRPKVVTLRKRYSQQFGQFSWFSMFLVIVLSGGEVPTETVLFKYF
jgi:hypothetical protein